MSELTKFDPKFYVETQDLSNTTHIKNKLLNKIKTCESLRNQTSLLFYLIRNKAYPTMRKDNTKHKIKEVWYDQKHKIVASRSIKRMAEDFGVHRTTIIEWLNDLKDHGLIEIERESRENVYILGVIKNNKEIYFYEEDITEEDVKLSTELMQWTVFLKQQMKKA